MKKYLYINSRDELYKIDIAKIVYFEAEGNYTNFVLSNKLKGAVCMNLAQMQKLINDNLHEAGAVFARIGKRYIVNLDFVYHINVLKQCITLSDGEMFAFHLPRDMPHICAGCYACIAGREQCCPGAGAGCFTSTAGCTAAAR